MAKWALVIGMLTAAAAAPAETDEAVARDDRIAELERKVETLTEELERTRMEIVVPALPELKSEYGMGPAASKIYGISQGLSVGGYAEGRYTNYVSDSGGNKDTSDWLRLVLYTGYKFTDNILFNAELEWEHATTEPTVTSGAGAVSVEFAALDFMIRDEANARAGLLLVPMGFLNEIHEPPFYFGVHRPEPERRIIPTTWRENGAGLFGSLFHELVEYRAYAINGFNAAGFNSSGLRDGRQNGNEALAEDWAGVIRLDTYPFDGLELGGSIYFGDSGQDQKLTNGAVTVKLPDTFTLVWETHAEYSAYNARLRGLFTMAHVGDAGKLTTALQAVGATTTTVAGEMLGGYVEIAYDVWKALFPESEKTFEPFFRWEYVDTQHDVPSGFAKDKSQRENVYTAGFSFMPIPNVVIKSDYRNRDPDSGKLADEFNLGVGLAF